MSSKLKIGLVGFGCVGSGLYEVLNRSNQINATIERIVVKDPQKRKPNIRQGGYAENFAVDRRGAWTH